MIDYDPARDEAQHYLEMEERLKDLPVCAECGEPIQDDYYYQIAGEDYCEQCVDAARRYL